MLQSLPSNLHGTFVSKRLNGNIDVHKPTLIISRFKISKWMSSIHGKLDCNVVCIFVRW